MIKNLAVLHVGDPLNLWGRQVCRARSKPVRFWAAVEHKISAMTWQCARYDISSLVKALKKFIAWLRDVFNNE